MNYKKTYPWDVELASYFGLQLDPPPPPQCTFHIEQMNEKQIIFLKLVQQNI